MKSKLQTWCLVLGLCLMATGRWAGAANIPVDPPVIAPNDNVANFSPPVVCGQIQSMAVDSAGNRYVAGYFDAVTDFNPGIGADERIPSSTDAFVTRYNADGSYAWTQTFGGSGDDIIHAVTVANGVVYATGESNSLDAILGGGVVVYASAQISDYNDAFVLALDATTGAAVTAFNGTGVQLIGGTRDEVGTAITVSAGVLYVGGYFNSPDTFIGGSSVLHPSANNLGDGFVVALNATTGAAVSGFGVSGFQTIAGTGFDAVESLALSGSYLYVAGETNSIDATVGGSGSIKTNATGFQNAFLLRLSATTGALDTTFNAAKGVQVFGGAGDSNANAVRVANGNIYVTGSFGGPNSGLNALGTVVPVGGASQDAFVLAFSETTGLPVSTFGTGGIVTFGGTDHDEGMRLEVLGTTLYVGGHFVSTDAGFGAAGTIASLGDDDVFILALNDTTGAPLSTFNGNGVQTLNGSGQEDVGGLVATSSELIVAGISASPDLGVGALGDYDTDAFGGYLLSLNLGSGAFTTSKSTSGGTGDNLAENDPPLINPETGVSIRVNKSNAGYVQLGVDFNTQSLAAFSSRAVTSASSSTDFEDSSFSRTVYGVSGKKPAHQFLKPGVFAATTHAIDDDTMLEKGRMRKTLALSGRETGASGALTPSSDPVIKVTALKGKFLFSKSTPDQVSFSGIITLPAGLDLSKTATQTLSVGVGNVTDNVSVNYKGKASLPSEKARIKSLSVKYPRLAKNATLTLGGEKATVQATYRTADLDLIGFDTEGITKKSTGKKGTTRTIQVAMVLGGVAYEALAPVLYKVTPNGESGGFSRTAK